MLKVLGHVIVGPIMSISVRKYLCNYFQVFFIIFYLAFAGYNKKHF